MSAKTHYLLASGQVRGLYGCGFHWWVGNPGKSATWHGKHYINMRFQGIHNKVDSRVWFADPLTHMALLGKNGYLQNLWKNGLENAIRPVVAALDVDMETRFDSEYRSHIERSRVSWTPYGSLAQALDDPAAAEWREHDHLVMQLNWASYALERQKNLRVFLVRNKSTIRYDNDRSGTPCNTAEVSMLLFEPWQWTSFHATLYSLCAPFMGDAPGWAAVSEVCERA